MNVPPVSQQDLTQTRRLWCPYVGWKQLQCWISRISRFFLKLVLRTYGRQIQGLTQSLTSSVQSLPPFLGPCGFRPFDLYSKLKIENQKFTIVIFNVRFLKNWKSQIYNLNCPIFVSKKHKIEKQFLMFWKSKIENWKCSVGGFYFLFLRKRKTKR